MIEKIHPIPAFTDNYIWAIHSADSNKVCVVDPGDAKPVHEYIDDNSLELTDILITHHHPDHIGGLAELTERYKPTVYGPEISNIKGITKFVQESDSLSLFGCEFRVIEVPGHTLDHLAYYSNDSDKPLLFCGDTLFAAGCGRLFEGTPEMMHISLAKLSALPSATLVYCTHEYTMANLAFAKAVEPANSELQLRIAADQKKRDLSAPTLPTTVKLELNTNPFLRCDVAAVIDSARAHAEKELASSTEIFAALRQWKDNF
ncbi:MAG: hydroxyacylglutathione hydrolase [Pseudohongiellaceae bacterium]